MSTEITSYPTVEDVALRQYQIIETESGLQISESRVMLFDVMEAYEAGDSIYDVSSTFNLSPLQVETAVTYIEQHRAKLQPQYEEAIRLRQEREHYYRALADERWRQIAELPLTPQQAAFYDLLKKKRYGVEGQHNATHPQRP